jgi:hypothetical protein
LKKLRAERIMVELELAKAKGLVSLVSDFERAQASRATVIRTNVLNVAQRAVLRLLGEHDETTFKRVLREELVTALKTAADAEIDLSTTEDEDHDEP